MCFLNSLSSLFFCLQTFFLALFKLTIFFFQLTLKLFVLSFKVLNILLQLVLVLVHVSILYLFIQLVFILTLVNFVFKDSDLCLQARGALILALWDHFCWFSHFGFTFIVWTAPLTLVGVFIRVRQNRFIPFRELFLEIILNVLVHKLSSFIVVENVIFHVADRRVRVLEEVPFLVVSCVSELVYQLVILQDSISEFSKPFLWKLKEQLAHLFRFIVTELGYFDLFCTHLLIKLK